MNFLIYGILESDRNVQVWPFLLFKKKKKKDPVRPVFPAGSLVFKKNQDWQQVQEN